MTMYEKPDYQLGILGCFGVLERRDASLKLEKTYEAEIEDEKIFIEEGQDVYRTIIH